MRRFSITAAAIVVATLSATCFGQSTITGVSRIVGFGDVHGAYDQLIALLRTNGIVDENLSWNAGDTHLVSLGDLLDRGPGARRVMDLLMRLQREAAEDGGRVHVVLGNHEHMNLIGDLRYVSDADYAAFAADESAAVREAAFMSYLAAHDVDESAARAEFDKRFPPGYFARERAFSPEGRYGKWLLSLPALIVIDGTVFAHGGLPPLLAHVGADEINERVHSNLSRYLELREDLAEHGDLPRYEMEDDREIATAALESAKSSGGNANGAAELEEFLRLDAADEVGADGPLWYRGTVYCKPIIEEPTLDAALDNLDARRLVVGHTPTGTREITTLYDGKVLMADTGMLAGYYSGRPSAFVLEDDSVTAEYVDPRETAPPRTGHYDDDYGLSEAELFEALRDGEIANVSEAGTEPPLAVTLRHRGKTIRAVFYPQDRREPGYLEIAAYGLSELLGLDLVPPTVARQVAGQDGALQLRYSDAVSEKERLDKHLLLGGWCDVNPQAQLMYAFDTLIANRSRSTANLLYRSNSSNIYLTDHRQTLNTERRLVGISDDAFTLSPHLKENLMALDEETLTAALGEWLDDRQIRALLSRRDEIVERF